MAGFGCSPRVAPGEGLCERLGRDPGLLATFEPDVLGFKDTTQGADDVLAECSGAGEVAHADEQEIQGADDLLAECSGAGEVAHTDEQKKAIERTIRDLELAFKAEVFGPESIPLDDYERLKAAGKIRQPCATQVARVVAPTPEVPAASETLAPKAPMTATEREAAAVARRRAREYMECAVLNTVTLELLSDLDEDQQRKALSLVQLEVASAIRDRRTAAQAAQSVKTRMKDYRHDWKQIVETEFHSSWEEGWVAATLKTLPPGSDPLVYKRPRPDACDFCKLLYLNGKIPRLLRLSELKANGTNLGRNANEPTLEGPAATDWKAVLGATHPWCQCTLLHFPEGFGFDAEGNMVYLGTSAPG